MLTTHLHLEVEVKNEWIYTCNPPVSLLGIDRDKFTLPSPTS